MNKLTFILLSVAMIGGFTASAQNKISLSFKSQECDLGKIKEEGGPKSGKYEFTNSGSDTLKILNVKPGCSCITADWTKTPVPPKGSGSITVTYDPKGRPGPLSKAVEVTSNDAARPKITLVLKAEVEPKQRTLAEEYPQVQGDLRFKNTQLFLQQMSNTETKTDSVHICNDWKQTMTLDFSKLPSHITVKAIPEKLKPREKGLLLVTYDARKKNDYGFIFEKFTILTNDTAQPEKNVSISLNITEDFSKLTPEQKANAPRIKFENTAYKFSAVKEGEKVEYDYAFSNTGKSELIIRKTKGSCGCTVSTPAKTNLQPGESSKIHVVFNTLGKPGEQHKSITVISNDPVDPTITLDINGTVEKKEDPNLQQQNK